MTFEYVCEQLDRGSQVARAVEPGERTVVRPQCEFFQGPCAQAQGPIRCSGRRAWSRHACPSKHGKTTTTTSSLLPPLPPPLPSTFEDQEVQHVCCESVLSVVPSVSVESAMECQLRVHDVWDGQELDTERAAL